ncbi:unnamed protein product [Arctogadus glacialis]
MEGSVQQTMSPRMLFNYELIFHEFLFPQSLIFSSSSQFMDSATGDFISKTNLEQIINGISHSVFQTNPQRTECVRDKPCINNGISPVLV